MRADLLISGKFALPQSESIAPPGNLVAGKAGDPDKKSNNVPNREQPQKRDYLTGLKNALSDQHCDGKPGGGDDTEQRPRPGCPVGEGQSQQSPGNAECKNQSEIARRTGAAQSASPTQLMTHELREGVSG